MSNEQRSDTETATADSDRHLLARMRLRDPAALEQLFRRYYHSVRRLLARMLGDDDLADDLAQDTFVALYTHPPQLQLDDEAIQAWLYKEAGAIVTHFDDWRTGLKRLVDLVGRQQYDEAATEGEAVRRMYPEYVSDANAYAFLAEIRLAKSDNAGALAILADYQKFGGEDPATLKKLASLQERAGQLPEAIATLNHVNEIYPVGDEDLHRRLGELDLKQKHYPGAIREYAAIVAMRPLDKAGALYNLASAYFAARQFDQAEHQVLGALEAAPGYRPAQQLLLQIQDARAAHP